MLRQEGIRRKSDVLGKMPVREVGETWGTGRAFGDAGVSPELERGKDSFGKATGVSWSQSHYQRNPGRWTCPVFLPHSSLEGAPHRARRSIHVVRI